MAQDLTSADGALAEGVRLRVAMLAHNYLPVIGGAERQIAALAPLLAARGIDLTMITRQPGDEPASETLDGVLVIRVDTTASRLPASLEYTRRALAVIRDGDFDVVHAHSLLSPGTTAGLARWRWGLPAIAKTLRGGEHSDLADLRRKGFGDMRFRLLDRALDGYVTISSEIDDELARLGVPDDRRWRIPNGVDTARFDRPSEIERSGARAELGLDGPTAVYVGRLVEEKRVDVLLEAWKAVRDAVPAAELLVAGDGPERATLASDPPDGVRFLGTVDDVRRVLHAADVFVLPSASEGLSNALLEAMSTGLPAVVTRVGGAPELISSSEQGVLVSPGDMRGLAAALIAELTDSTPSSRRRAAIRERVVATHALEITADRLAALYRSLARGRDRIA